MQLRVDNGTHPSYEWGMDTMTSALRRLIETDGRSLNELGRITGIDPGMLSRFVRGERTLTLESVDAFTTGLGCTVKITTSTAAKAGKSRKTSKRGAR